MFRANDANLQLRVEYMFPEYQCIAPSMVKTHQWGQEIWPALSSSHHINCTFPNKSLSPCFAFLGAILSPAASHIWILALWVGALGLLHSLQGPQYLNRSEHRVIHQHGVLCADRGDTAEAWVCGPSGACSQAALPPGSLFLDRCWWQWVTMGLHADIWCSCFPSLCFASPVLH